MQLTVTDNAKFDISKRPVKFDDGLTVKFALAFHVCNMDSKSSAAVSEL